MSIVVVAAVIVEDGRVLVTQRPAGTHLAGMWEFPGGKVEADEDPRDALERELREELGIEAAAGEVVDVTFHRYPTKSVLILFFEACRKAFSPPPRRIGVADLAWQSAEELRDEQFPPADVKILAKVRAMLRNKPTCGMPAPR